RQLAPLPSRITIHSSRRLRRGLIQVLDCFMELPGGRSDVASLTKIGAEAANLIKEQNYKGLADRFGYALARNVDPANAIQADVDACLSRGWAVSRSLMMCSPTIAV